MEPSLSDLLRALTPDPWRATAGFSVDIEESRKALHSGRERDSLGAWLQRHQPCLFGRNAAKLGLITYCFLTEDDIHQGDAHVRDVVQAARTEWKREAMAGRKSGFIISVISPAMDEAVPNEGMLAFARRLTQLYLLRDILPDQIYMDTVRLEFPGERRTTWEWEVGVNYFSAQADKRWWQDHRIPDGMSLSMNSVGHMAKSGLLGKVMADLTGSIEAPDEGWKDTHLASLAKALVVAMQTIDRAAKTESGRATELIPIDAARRDSLPRCPVKLPAHLDGLNHCEYLGYYHTDQTLASAYFLPDVARPQNATQSRLDFTYLFDDTLDNAAHLTMGQGVLVRSDELTANAERRQKRARVKGREVSNDD